MTDPASAPASPPAAPGEPAPQGEPAPPPQGEPATAAPAEPPPPVLTVVLVRHGRSTANTAGLLAGRTPGVNLDEYGRGQAAAIADRLAGISIDRVLSSPMDRCVQTITPFAAAAGLAVELDDRFAEVDYGDWSGRKLSELAAEPLWRTVQQHPSAAVFPAGEGLAGVSHRAAAAICDLRGAAPRDQTVMVCSHGDVIKAILADALGMHLDSFQRIVVAPASLSVIRYTPLRPFVERVNDTGELGLLRPLPPPDAQPTPTGSAQGAGPSAPDPSSDAPGHDASDAVPGGVTH